MKRRTFLQSAGLALMLPPLESFGELAETSAPPRRLLTIVNHLGFYQPALIPESAGPFQQAPELLDNFAEHHSHLNVFSGLDNPGVQLGLGHTPCVGILSGYFNKLQRKNRISIDQAVAELIGDQTRFRSLVFQAGQNLNFSQVAWDQHGMPVRQLDSPQQIFNLLFGVDPNQQQRKHALGEDRSILDVVSGQARRMQQRVSAVDRAKIEEYLTSVREVERAVRRQSAWVDRPKPETDYEIAEFATSSVDAYVRVMLELAVLALETDSTRSLTLQIPFWEGFKQPEISGSYHDFSHHGQKPEKIEKLLRMEHAILRRVSEALTRMKDRRVGSQSLFEQTTTLVTASMGNASAHTFNDLPALVFDSRIRSPQHRRFEGVPMCNLYLSLLQHFGGQIETFGESTGTVELVA
jgi:hypothetical protein